MKKTLFFVPIAVALAVIILGAPVFASEHEEVNANEEVTELTEQERQALLTEIAKQLEEVERELLVLSLAVQKLALEQQALALQEQLDQTMAGGALTAEEEEGIAVPVPGTETPETIVAQEPTVGDEAVVLEETVAQEGELDAETLALEQAEIEEEGEEAEEERGGFLAGLGPLSNLGTPELAVLAILVFLVAFMLVRRLRERRHQAAPSAPLASSKPSFQSPLQQDALEERRDELKERVAWE